MKKERKFGLFTSICMIVGIVIGSGIFFKSDNVLVYTNGNITLGVIVFIIAAMAIIFGSLAMSELAIRTNETGGIIAYAEKYLGKRIACVFGWFQNFVYYPTIVAVVSWAMGMYFCLLFTIPASTEMEIIIGFIACIGIYIIQYLSTRLVGCFQNIATLIKLIPIFMIIIAALAFGNQNFDTVTTSTATSTSWIAAIGPIAFSYDGWIVATGISHEIKDTHRNLPLALIIAPIFILGTYLAYFIGVCILVSPEQIIRLGDAHVDVAAMHISGSIGAKLFIVFVLVSVMGTSNGIILGNSRGIYALGIKNMIPKSKRLSSLHKKWSTPYKSILLSLCIVSIWIAIHYVTLKFKLLINSDVSEISIVTMYLFYILLYIQVMKLRDKKEITSNIKGYIIPSLAILGSLVIFFGGMQNTMFWMYSLFSLLVIIIAYSYAIKNF